ncbi:hypothetical protein [Caenimonas sp. SL110]|uniref:hypothetical protein n=1 Tax=Caenimonas sp. SL110 TaxID=1450524 RepID=UPI000653B72F|nr:hypothetical protein [Caenimonas sp. SL110]
MSTGFKSIVCTAAVVIAGSAFAQGTPPNAAIKDPAVGAGQQSTQSTPMGTTGTPGGNTTGNTTGRATTPMTGSSTTTTGTASSTADTTMASARPMKKARADRN